MNSTEEGHRTSDNVELQDALNLVSKSIPLVSWRSMEDAMTVCIKKMSLVAKGKDERPKKNEEVIQFMKEYSFHILNVMVSLNAIEGYPKSFSALQRLWKPEKNEEFLKCFHMGLSDCLRLMLRIGYGCSITELCSWHDYTKSGNGIYRNNWISSLELLMDCEQLVYRSDDGDGNIDPLPNSLWTTCLNAFFEEGGFDILVSLLNPDDMKKLAEDKVVERNHILYCKIARVIKRLVTRGHVIIGQPNMPSADAVSSAMSAVEMVAAYALDWVIMKLETSPETLEEKGTTKDMGLIDCIMELIGSDQIRAMVQKTLSFTDHALQVVGMRLAQGLSKEDRRMLSHEYLETLETRFNGSGDEIVKQLRTFHWLLEEEKDKEHDDGDYLPVIILKELLNLMETDEDKSKVCILWGDIGLRCMCTSDHHTRALGCGLLYSLRMSQPEIFQPQLASAANQAWIWLMKQCDHSDLISVLNLENNELDFMLFSIHGMLVFSCCEEEATSIAAFWIDTSIKLLRSRSDRTREHGIRLLQGAVQGAVYTENVALNRGIGRDLSRLLQVLLASRDCLEDVLHSLFSKEHADPKLIAFASKWLVEVYYRELCYEDDQIDIMKYLVDAAVHPEWGVAEVVTDLLVNITITNISIRSLNSLCSLFKEAINNEATSLAANKLILTWVEKTSEKKWVVAVQERFLNLLWTMYMNFKNDVSEEESDTKILRYFNNQLLNIKHHVSSDWNGTECDLTFTDRALTARYCIMTCATDSFAEIRRCVDFTQQQQQQSSSLSSSSMFGNTSSSYQPEVLRSRCAKAGYLLSKILLVMDELRPDILREICCDGSPSHMLDALVEEALVSAACDDVVPTELFIRLSLISNIASYIIETAPLTFKIINTIMNTIFDNNGKTSIDKHHLSRHYRVCSRWLIEILKPQELSSDHVYFETNIERIKTSKYIFEQLSYHIQHSPTKLMANDDVIKLFVFLFIWINMDRGGLSTKEVHKTCCVKAMLPRYSELFELDYLTVNEEELFYFDILASVALDVNPCERVVVIPACYTLLEICAACFNAKKHPPLPSSSISSKASSCFMNTIHKNNLPDFLELVFTRITKVQQNAFDRSSNVKYTASEIAFINHWLSMLLHFFNGTSSDCSSPPHEGGCQGETIELTVSFLKMPEDDIPVDDENDLITKSLIVHDHMILSDVVAAAKKLLFEENQEALLYNYVLRRRDVKNEKLIGDHNILKNFDVVANVEFWLEMESGDDDPSFSTNPMWPSPAEQFSVSKLYNEIIFGLLNNEETCESAWNILQKVPSLTSELLLIQNLANHVNWVDCVFGQSRSIWHRLYSCQLVEAKLYPASLLVERNEVDAWHHYFITTGGLKAMLGMLDEGEEHLSKINSRISSLLRVLLSPMKIISFVFDNELINIKVSSKKSTTHVIEEEEEEFFQSSYALVKFSNESCDHVRKMIQLKDVLNMMFKIISLIIRTDNGSDYSESEVETVVIPFIKLMNKMIQHLDNETWSKININFPLNSLIQLLIYSPLKQLRYEVSMIFKELMKPDKVYTLYKKVIMKDDDDDGVETIPSSLLPLPAINVLGPLFFGDYLIHLTYDCSTAKEYFSICNDLLNNPGSWFHPHYIRLSLETKLQSFKSSPPPQQVCEKDGNDSVLIGVLSTLSKLHTLDPPSPQEAQGLVDSLLTTFLMRMQQGQLND